MTILVDVALLNRISVEVPFHLPIKLLKVGCSIVGVSDICNGQGKQIVAAVPGDRTKLFVDPQKASVLIDFANSHESMLVRSAKPLLVLPQARFRPLPVCEVAQIGCEMGSAGDLNRVDGQLDREPGATRTERLKFDPSSQNGAVSGGKVAGHA
jgi:hypothetical protein